ncbi:TetR/AcrR family transcriptional regulator [Microbacterium sp. P07]|uniref:TetR/AcrR family transcriptional regulator n=1 Tax=Microbacterium sp. P07 TaxID=3366952 RepID=UPI0037458A09
MPSAEFAERNRLAVSERVALAFVDTGYAVPIARICERAGVSERTFYRYFPRKPDAIRPVLERGIELIGEALRERPSGALADVLVGAFERSLWGERGIHTAQLVPLILREPALYAVWLSTIHGFEAVLGDAIDPWLIRPVSDLERRVIAAALVAAMRIAFESSTAEGAEPVTVFREAVAAISVPAIALNA